jgi:hypothetical protein
LGHRLVSRRRDRVHSNDTRPSANVSNLTLQDISDHLHQLPEQHRLLASLLQVVRFFVLVAKEFQPSRQ